MTAGNNAGFQRGANTLSAALWQAKEHSERRYAAAWDAAREAQPGMTWWCGWCLIAGVSLPNRREVVVESDASIDGSP
jgi:hypothetical protein